MAERAGPGGDQGAVQFEIEGGAVKEEKGEAGEKDQAEKGPE